MIVRNAVVADLPAAVDLLARAFRDNPLNRALLGADPGQRERANRAGLRASLPVSLRHGTVLCASDRHDLAGVLIAAPPGAFPFPVPPLGGRLRAAWAQGARASKDFGVLFETLASQHPVIPHWYLATLGVAEERQGAGIGRRLLKSWLVEVDRCGVAAYLETDRDRNRRLYESFGFGVTKRFAFRGAPVWLMQRPSRVRFQKERFREAAHRWGTG